MLPLVTCGAGTAGAEYEGVVVVGTLKLPALPGSGLTAEGRDCSTFLATGAVTSFLRTPIEALLPPIPPGLEGAGATDGLLGEGVDGREKDEEEEEDRDIDDPLEERPMLPASAGTLARKALANISVATNLLDCITKLLLI